MPATARQMEARSAHQPALSVVRGHRPSGSGRTKRTSAVAARRLYFIVCAMCAVLVLGGMASVWLSTDAVRISQRVMYINDEISSQLIQTDRLELKRSSLASATRIERIATRELGMVPVGDRVTFVEISDLGGDQALTAQPDVSTQGRAAVSGPVEALGALAKLTLGEAQVLLVGDIGLSSSW